MIIHPRKAKNMMGYRTVAVLVAPLLLLAAPWLTATSAPVAAPQRAEVQQVPSVAVREIIESRAQYAGTKFKTVGGVEYEVVELMWGVSDGYLCHAYASLIDNKGMEVIVDRRDRCETLFMEGQTMGACYVKLGAVDGPKAMLTHVRFGVGSDGYMFVAEIEGTTGDGSRHVYRVPGVGSILDSCPPVRPVGGCDEDPTCTGPQGQFACGSYSNCVCTETGNCKQVTILECGGGMCPIEEFCALVGFTCQCN